MKNFKNFISRHDEAAGTACCILLIAALAASIYGFVRYKQNAAKNQAVARAKSMDGRIYTIDNVAWNWIGDTKLILKNEHGTDAGWIMIYHANPLDSKINPLTLSFTNPYGRVPVPMKVKTHYRENPWTSKYDGKTKENFTGSFIEFEEAQ
jgi:hypothetical protein